MNTSDNHRFDDKFIAFIDIVGFTAMVEAAEAGTGRSLSQIKEILSMLGTSRDEHRFDRYGPTLCPSSQHDQKNLDFRITQVSDCAIVSSEVSPAGIINLIQHCWMSVADLLVRGVMCRGYITRGSIHHRDGNFMGSGYHSASKAEKSVTAFKMEADERGTPFVEIDPQVFDYARRSADDCVLRMFHRMTKTEEGVTALFPFSRFSHSFVIGGLDAMKEKENNDRVRKMIHHFKENVLSYIDPSNEPAMRKARHYLKALDQQLEICAQTDEMIDRLCSPFPKWDD